jgi:hypothetical protein
MSDTNERELLKNFIIKFIKLAPIFKHPKFKAEREWRIIAGLRAEVTNSIKFRSCQSMIVPFIEIPLPKRGDNLIIDQIVVGPTNESQLSKAPVETMLRSKNVIFDKVECSTIPYRNL